MSLGIVARVHCYHAFEHVILGHFHPNSLLFLLLLGEGKLVVDKEICCQYLLLLRLLLDLISWVFYFTSTCDCNEHFRLLWMIVVDCMDLVVAFGP